MKSVLYKPAALRTYVPAYLLVASAALGTNVYAADGGTQVEDVVVDVKRGKSQVVVDKTDATAATVKKTGAGDLFLGGDVKLENAKTVNIEAGRLVLTRVDGKDDAMVVLGEKGKFNLKKSATLAGSGLIAADQVQLNGTVALDGVAAGNVSTTPEPGYKIERTGEFGQLTVIGNAVLDGATFDVDLRANGPDKIAVSETLEVTGKSTVNLRSLTFADGQATTGAVLTAKTLKGSDKLGLTIGGQKTVDFLTLKGKQAENTNEYTLDARLNWFDKDQDADGKLKNAHGTFTVVSDSFVLEGDLKNRHLRAEDSVSGWDGNSLSKQGKGTLVLNGENTYTGATVVKQGTLMVGDAMHQDARIKSAVKVEEGATLTGVGHIEQDVTVDGRLQGSLQIAEKLTLNSGAVLASDLSAQGTTVKALDLKAGSAFEVKASKYDRKAGGADRSTKVNVTGTVTIADGVRVRIVRDGNMDLSKAKTYTYTILQAGEVSGKLNLDDDWAFLTGKLTEPGQDNAQADGAVKVTIARNDSAYASIGTTANQAAVGAAITALETENANHEIVQQVLWLGARQARAAYDTLSGEIYGSTRAAVLGDQHLRDAVVGRASIQGAHLWVAPWGQQGRAGGKSGVADVKTLGHGVAVGAQSALSDALQAGVFVAHEDKDVKDVRDVKDVHYAHGYVKGYSAGVYAAAQAGMVEVRGGVAYSWLTLGTQRNIDVGAVQGWVMSEHEANKVQVFAEVAAPLTLGADVKVSPYLGVSHAWLHSNVAVERGNAGALEVQSRDDKAFFTTLGARLALDLPMQKLWSVTADLGWQHAAGDVDGKVQYRFAGTRAGFAAQGQGVAKNALVTGLGLQASLAKNASLTVGYHGQFGAGEKDHSATARVQMQF